MSRENEITWGNFKNPLIITGGIGIFISFMLLVFSFISDTVFIGLISIILGVCFVVHSRSNIESFEATLKGLAIKFKSQGEKINAMAIKQIEPRESPPTNTQGSSPGIICESYGTDEETKLVIKSIGGTKYTFRNVEGIIADSKLPCETAKDKLNWLLINGLANSFDIDGEKLYALSSKGHRVFEQVVNPTKQKAEPIA